MAYGEFLQGPAPPRPPKNARGRLSKPGTKKGKKRRLTRLQKFNKTPFKPMQSPFETWGDLWGRAGSLARAELEPQLEDVRGDLRYENRAHKGRKKDIGIAYGAADTRVRKSYDALQRSLTKLMAAQSGMQGAALSDAGASMGNVGADAASLGVGAPQMTNLMGGAGLIAQSNNMMSGGNIGALLQLAGSERGNIGLEGMQQYSREAARHGAEKGMLRAKKADIRKNLGPLRGKYATQLLEGEREAASTRFQQWVARQELKDADAERKLRERELDITEVTNNRNYELAQQELAQAAKEAEAAGDEDALNEAELQADAMRNAAEYATTFMGPKGKWEEKHPGKIKDRRSSDQLFRALRTQFGLSRRQAAAIVRVYWKNYAAPGSRGRKRQREGSSRQGAHLGGQIGTRFE